MLEVAERRSMIRRTFTALMAMFAAHLGVLGTAAVGQSTSGTVESTPLATSIVVEKRAHRMTVYHGDRVLRRFQVALGRGGLAPKMRQGDRRVPEGSYFISGSNPRSSYHLSLRISYPTAEQVAAAAARGDKAGGDIMIHGLPNGRGAIGANHLKRDWTDGCIAVTNAEIEWLWAAVPDGTPIHIRP